MRRRTRQDRAGGIADRCVRRPCRCGTGSEPARAEAPAFSGECEAGHPPVHGRGAVANSICSTTSRSSRNSKASRCRRQSSAASVTRSSGPTRRCSARSSSLPRHGQSGAELSEMLPHLAKIVDDICLVKSVTHRPVQPRAGADFLQHRVLPAGPAVPRVVGALRPRRRDPGPAGVRRDVHRQRASAAARQLGRAASCRPSTPASDSATGRPDPQRLEPAGRRRQLQRDTLDLVGITQPTTPCRRRRPGDRHPDRLLRNGVPAADLRAGVDGPQQRVEGNPRSLRRASRPSHRSPAPACWPGG